MLIFRNPGLIDLDAALTMGVSVKDSDSPIGYFGTGFKFAVATILRNGGSVELQRGADRHVFAAERAIIRGEEFDMITMDGRRLGFTTMLGRNWQPWMAFRELASNCRDEGGEYFQTNLVGTICTEHSEGRTTFIVGGLDDIWPERTSILLESQAIMSNRWIEIHPGDGQYVFYRGVRIFNPSPKTAVRYNIVKDLKLTEDRTAESPWSVQMAIARGIATLTDRPMLRQLMTCGKGYLEGNLDLDWMDHSTEFAEVGSELGMGAERIPSLNESVAAKARKMALNGLKHGDSIALTQIEQKMLDRACHILIEAGYNVRSFPIIVQDNLGPGIMGLADDGRILLSRLAFEKGTRELASTLIEEFAHLRSGAGDFTREMQNWLFEHLLGEIERNIGEPF